MEGSRLSGGVFQLQKPLNSMRHNTILSAASRIDGNHSLTLGDASESHPSTPSLSFDSHLAQLSDFHSNGLSSRQICVINSASLNPLFCVGSMIWSSVRILWHHARLHPAFLSKPFQSVNLKLSILKMSMSTSERKRKQGSGSPAPALTGWLDVTNPEKKQRFAQPCEWIKREEAYRNWCDDDSPPILWIHGSPGCGKTFLAKYIVDQFRDSEEKSTVISYFCDADSSLACILSSIESQLWRHPSLDEEFREKKRRESVLPAFNNTPSASDRTFLLWDQITELLKMGLEFRLIVDGVDELPDQALQDQGFNFPARLVEMATQSWSKIKLLITSQTEPFMQALLEGHPNISITPKKVKDLERFIRSEVEQFHFLAPFVDDISPELVRQSEGSFLWACLCVGELNSRAVQGQVPDVKSLPSQVGDLYGRILERQSQRMSRRDIDSRDHILKWLVNAKRPLSGKELSTVRMVETNLSPLEQAHATQLCGSLVIEEENTLKPVHHTLRQFLLKAQPGMNNIIYAGAKKANTSIALTCLKYLSHPAFNRPLYEMEENVGDPAVEEPYSFLEYASLYWIHHVCNAEKSLELQDLARRPANSARILQLFTMKSQLVRYFEEAEKKELDEQITTFLRKSHEKALADERQRDRPKPIQEIKRTIDLAEIYGWLPDHKSKAQPLLREALALCSILEDTDGKILAIEVQQALADDCKRGGKYEEALDILTDLISRASLVLQPNDMRNMFALDSLGWVCMRLNRLDESARNLEGALKIATANYGSLSTFTLRSKVTLAEVLNKLGRADEAEVLCTELKTQVQQNRDNGTPLPKDSISQLNTLAAVYVQQKKFDEAIETYGAIVDDRKKIFGDAHPMTLWATMQWAIAKESKGSLEEALRMFEDLLPKQIKILGETHPDVKEGKSRLQGLKSRLALVESENI